MDDAELTDIALDPGDHHGIIRRSDIGREEIVERLLYLLVNEGLRILEEGIAYRPGDIDVVWGAGYGFPDFRGGPMRMADVLGLRHTGDRLARYGATRGNDYGAWGLVMPLCEVQGLANVPLAAAEAQRDLCDSHAGAPQRQCEFGSSQDLLNHAIVHDRQSTEG